MKLEAIKSIQDVKEFVRTLMEDENLNFHPDTPFQDYVSLETGRPYYNSQQVQLRNDLLKQCFALGNKTGVDTHELMCDEGLSMVTQRVCV